MLMRTDPFRDLDRLTQQLLGTNARPSAMLMDAWRDGEQFVVEFDLPGVSPDSVDLDVERNVLTVTAQRPPLDEKAEFLAAERPRGVFSRQLVLGDNVDLDRIEAGYRDGVLRLVIPVAEKAKPRKITINRDAGTDQEITTGHTTETASSATTTPSTPRSTPGTHPCPDPVARRCTGAAPTHRGSSSDRVGAPRDQAPRLVHPRRRCGRFTPGVVRRLL